VRCTPSISFPFPVEKAPGSVSAGRGQPIEGEGGASATVLSLAWGGDGWVVWELGLLR
jgi:hypothetical protein